MRPIGPQSSYKVLSELAKIPITTEQLMGFYYLSIGLAKQCVLYVLQHLFPYIFLPIEEKTLAGAVIDRVNAIDLEALENILHTMVEKQPEPPPPPRPSLRPPPGKSDEPAQSSPIFSREIEGARNIRKLRDSMHAIKLLAMEQASDEERNNYADYLSRSSDQGSQLSPFAEKMAAFDQRIALIENKVKEAKGAEDFPGDLFF